MKEEKENHVTHPAWNIDVTFIHDSCTSTLYRDEGRGVTKFEESLQRATRIVKVQEAHLTGKSV